MAVRFNVYDVVALADERPVGVICTPAGWIRSSGALADSAVARMNVRAMLALEHGLRGELQDGVHFESYVDERSGVPVYSFYGGTGHTFPADVLDELRVIVFHAQDVSHRAYTYKQTLAASLAAAAERDIHVVVLDRPTPLGYLGNRGPLWTQFFPEPIPVINGFTLGELARWLVRTQELSVRLDVIPVEGWRRSMTWAETGLPWIPPSPNIPAVDSALAYACTGALQHTSISEGRGCCKPFEYVGSPFTDARALTEALNAASLPGVIFREVYYVPAFNKYQGEVCRGVHLMFTDPMKVEPLRTLLTLLREWSRLHPGDVTLDRGFGRWLDGEAWDVARVRDLDVPGFLAAASGECETFNRSIEPDLIYGPVSARPAS